MTYFFASFSSFSYYLCPTAVSSMKPNIDPSNCILVQDVKSSQTLANSQNPQMAIADGYQGTDCSKSVCPVLCSAHGHYGGGVCHCEDGWKGSECDIPIAECEMATCSSHGRCIEGECHCERGWKGLFCDQPDCLDPSCSGHGSCVSGQCFCKAGWQGEDCGTRDQQVYQCLPGCSDHGHYDLETGTCICERHWTGVDCSQTICNLECGPNGICESSKCRCNAGWTGALCEQLTCDSRCVEHGQCRNGTCVCSQGWNGRHCTLRKEKLNILII